MPVLLVQSWLRSRRSKATLYEHCSNGKRAPFGMLSPCVGPSAGPVGVGGVGAGRATISSPGTGSRPANRQASTTKGAAAPGCSHRENARLSRRLTSLATGEVAESLEPSQALARFQLSSVSMRSGGDAAALPGEGADDGALAGGVGGADKMSSFLELLGAWCAPGGR